MTERRATLTASFTFQELADVMRRQLDCEAGEIVSVLVGVDVCDEWQENVVTFEFLPRVKDDR